MISALAARPLAIAFRGAFTHASASRAATQAIVVRASGAGGATGWGEGCPREYVTGESVAGALAFVERHAVAWQAGIADLPGLAGWAASHRALIDANPAAWCAAELAILDLLGHAHGQPVDALLGLPRIACKFRYTAVIGDGPAAQFAAQLAKYRAAGFAEFKIKLSGDRQRDAEKVAALRASGIEPARVRADANNLWRSAAEAIAALRGLEFPFHALEEPLAPGDYAGMARLAGELGCRIILDESLSRAEQLEALGAGAWIANVRVSKMGGVLRSLEVLRAAQAREIPVIVGAHVGETSLLARAALTVAAASGPALVSQEGAFGTHLLERDIAEPPVVFGAGGVLDPVPFAAAPGWGLRILDV
jgi:L-alanine-DL-glutamate epimerase-like enolase superfamily enzyme